MHYIYTTNQEDFEPISIDVTEELHKQIVKAKENYTEELVALMVWEEEYQVEAEFLHLTH